MKMFRALFNSTKVKLEEHEVEADQSSVTYTPPGSKVALLSAWEGPQHKWHKDRDDALRWLRDRCKEDIVRSLAIRNSALARLGIVNGWMGK